MATTVLFLIGFPLLVSAILLAVTSTPARNAVVVAACATLAAAAVVAAVQFGNGETIFFGLPGGATFGHALLLVEAAVALFVVGVGAVHRRVLAPLLALAQLGVSLGGALLHPGHAPEPGRLFAFDRLAMVMVLVVGVVGALICVHALGFMRDFHRRYPLVKGRRTSFFFLLFLFVSAMVGLVCANDLPLLYVFWEVTTVCSFLLIGYTRTRETVGHAFRALELNLLGGLGFAIAIVLLARLPDGLDLARLTAGPAAAAALPAVALLALAGLTKSAQMPFSSWLLGAMYAPSPTSALLHSSTMVKAGVFLLLRLAPAMAGSAMGTGVALVGLLTFLFASLVATTEENAKKVLAWSTIGNLGLVVGCAGVASPAALWAGLLLVIFHAVAKSLCFLVIGTIENRLYTKELEHLDNLVSRMPGVAVLALTGASGMFVAPFGVVIAKWSAIRAFLEVPGWPGAVFLLVMAFGSACTIFYWGKLLVKVLAARRISPAELAVEGRVTGFEWFAEGAHALLVVALAAGVGALSRHVVTPWALGASGAAGGELLRLDGLAVTVLVLATVALPLLALRAARHPRHDLADIYAGGRNVDADHRVEAAGGGTRPVTLRSYYLEGVVNGPRIFRLGTAVCGLVLSVTILLGTVRP